MRAMSATPQRAVALKTHMTCADNTGAKEVYLISVFNLKTRKRRIPKAGIGDMINIVVSKGKPELRKKIFMAIVIRTKSGLTRANGLKLKFVDNAVVLVDKDGVPKGTEIKGAVPKEIGERWPKIAGKASMIV
ncbi:MAG: 50S ribosomal protein L14 [Candidatus Diapherotrites archaeon CG09_land_8_20_14_0_10_32_12]|nr:MAG: 50S ribosomal protein L14 [Candidatus Diapherotrites archaeon CG09_land_8_20_14_0_10_32_12]